jgi:hypothetical protein
MSVSVLKQVDLTHSWEYLKRVLEYHMKNKIDENKNDKKKKLDEMKNKMDKRLMKIKMT